MRNAAVILLAFLAGATHARASAGTLPVDGFAAMVNQRVVRVSDVIAYIQPADQQLRDVYTGEELQKKREEAFDSGLQALIERALILEDFASQEKQPQLPERVINDRINEMINERFQNDRAAFLQALIDEQITLDEWKQETRDRLIVSILRRQEVTDKVKVSPTQVRDLYESQIEKYRFPARVNLSVIVINQGKDDKEREAKLQQAVLARGKVLGGTDFADVAKEYSEGSRAAEGGDWGWLEEASLRPELKSKIQALKNGEVSDIIEVDDAYYIVVVNDRKDAGVTPFEDIRVQLESEVKKAETDRLYNQWMQRLRRKHFVQVF